MPYTNDIGTLENLLADENWQEVFGEGTGGICDKSKVDECPPGSEVDRTPPAMIDVVEIIAASNGANDDDSWVGVFKLADGRFLVAEGFCDYTGWD